MDNSIRFEGKRNYNYTPTWTPRHEFNDDHKGHKVLEDNYQNGNLFISQRMAGGKRKVYKNIQQQSYHTENFDPDEPLEYLQPVFTRFN